jgi:translocator assembly and maintenance protein 41
MGAACYYNTLVPFRIVDEQNEEFHLIKYGLIGREAFERDLTNWDYLYMSGRMHKPVKIIKNNLDDSKLQTALNVNLSNALHTALLILPEKFKLVDLFICITSLSYMGDFRMVIGENKQKCSNIVLPQIDRFTQLYKSHIQNASAHLNCNFASGHLEQDRSLKSIQNNLKRLPSNLLFKMASAAAIKLDNRDEIERSLENERKDHGELVSQAINSVVKHTSLTQTIKGLLTAGVYKSVVYASRKLKKMFN